MGVKHRDSENRQRGALPGGQDLTEREPRFLTPPCVSADLPVKLLHRELNCRKKKIIIRVREFFRRCPRTRAH